MMYYRERLLPGPWAFINTGLLIPASLLVFLPINTQVGVAVAIILYVAAVLVLIATSPVVSVDEKELVAGRARIPLENVGEITGFSGKEATAERMARLDARAWLVIRGWIDPVVKVQVLDERDPAPYWLVSTRRPAALISAVADARTRS